MVIINLKELRLQMLVMTLTELAAHYKVDLFDLSNFIYSHKGRNGTYPVDGRRDQSNVKPSYVYPGKLILVNKLKAGKSLFQIAKELKISYDGLRRHAVKIKLE